jgi:hypothetical protein
LREQSRLRCYGAPQKAWLTTTGVQLRGPERCEGHVSSNGLASQPLRLPWSRSFLQPS